MLTDDDGNIFRPPNTGANRKLASNENTINKSPKTARAKFPESNTLLFYQAKKIRHRAEN